METVNQTLQLAAQLNTLTLILVVILVFLVIAAPALYVFLRASASRQQRLDDRVAAREKVDDDLRKIDGDLRKVKAETEQRIQESQTKLEATLQEAQVKRESASFGILSQLAAQAETQQTIQQQTLNVLERTVAQQEQITAALDKSITGIAERNKIQAAATEAMREGFVAVQQDVTDTSKLVIGRLENLAGDVSRNTLMHQEERSAINVISQRLDEKHADLIKRVEDLPTVLTRELKPVVDQWSAANEKLSRIGDATLEAVEQLKEAEHKLIEAIERALPPPKEVAMSVPVEALPINDRPAITTGVQ